MLDKQTAFDVIAEALKTGGDFAEIFMEDTLNDNLLMRSGAIESVVSGRQHGAGVRVLSGLRGVYAYTNDTSREGLIRCAHRAASAVKNEKMTAPAALFETRVESVHSFAKMPSSVKGARKVEKLRAAHGVLKNYPEIKQGIISYADSEQRVTIANSEGLFVSDLRVYSRFRVSAVASDGKENQTGIRSPGALRGFELFDGTVDPERCAKEAAECAIEMLKAPFCPAGIMPVVIGNGFGGVIFHEACGHSLEATCVAVGNSEFCGKLGQKIASDKVTAIDDGTLPNEWGSENIDDEGTPTNRLVLIEKGVLKNYMIDKLNARRMGLPVTGSSRREGYMYAPTSRMRNTYIAPGTDDDDEMISTMGDGLYAAEMGGGSVNPVTGEFNFAVNRGYLVKGGKIVHAVRGASLIGHGGEILPKIDRVGKHLELAQGVCGSISGGVPVNVGQPMIRVSSITVGGR